MIEGWKRLQDNPNIPGWRSRPIQAFHQYRPCSRLRRQVTQKKRPRAEGEPQQLKDIQPVSSRTEAEEKNRAILDDQLEKFKRQNDSHAKRTWGTAPFVYKNSTDRGQFLGALDLRPIQEMFSQWPDPHMMLQSLEYIVDDHKHKCTTLELLTL